MRFRFRVRGPSITFEFSDEPEYEEVEEEPSQIGGGSSHNFERSAPVYEDDGYEDRGMGFQCR